jgi:nucleoside-diphosphate-sugar epimerase
LNAPPFFENVRALTAKTVADQSTIFLPWGDGDAVIPLVAAEDCARVAAALLIAPDAPDQKRYDLVGETPTVNEITSILSAVLNRPVRYVNISDECWVQAVQDRINRHALEHLSSLWRFFRTSGIRKGESGFGVSEAIERLTGVGPQTLEQFFRMNLELFAGSQPRE